MSGAASITEPTDDAETIDVEAEVAAIAGSLNMLNARLVEVMAHAIDTEQLLGPGIHSYPQWLAYHAGMSPHHAETIIAVAKQRGNFPTVIRSFDHGQIALDQVHVVVTRAPAWADDRVAHFARNATVQQLRRKVRHESFEGDPDQPTPTRRQAGS